MGYRKCREAVRWSLKGPFKGQEGRTKTLMFSAWDIIPDVVGVILSYEADRRMLGGQLESYLDPAKQQAPRLRLSHTVTGTRARDRLPFCHYSGQDLHRALPADDFHLLFVAHKQ